MARKSRDTKLPAPFLKRILCRPESIAQHSGYPFDLPWLNEGDFDFAFTTPVTILVGENGTGKSTLIEAVAALAGFDEAGGGNGYMPLDHSRAIDRSGAGLASCLTGQWLPKLTHGWFFRAESFFSIARYLDQAAIDAGEAPPDFLSWSHGEGFIRFFEERCRRQGLYLFDEPESALSPRRQLELLRLLAEIGRTARAQVIMATHSPLLMAVPGARLLEITRFGIEKRDYRETANFRLLREFTADPEQFVAEALQNGDEDDMTA